MGVLATFPLNASAAISVLPWYNRTTRTMKLTKQPYDDKPSPLAGKWHKPTVHTCGGCGAVSPASICLSAPTVFPPGWMWRATMDETGISGIVLACSDACATKVSREQFGEG